MFPIEDSGQPDDTRSGPFKQWSEELQLSGEIGPLSYQFGGFYLESHNDPTIDFSLNQNVRFASQTFTWSRTKAVYDQGTYEFGGGAEGLSLTAGYRYTWDWRRQRNRISCAWRSGRGRCSPIGSSVCVRSRSRPISRRAIRSAKRFNGSNRQ